MFDATKERARLTKQAAKLQEEIELLNVRLSSEGFVRQAKPQFVDQTRKALRDKEERLAAITKSIAELE